MHQRRLLTGLLLLPLFLVCLFHRYGSHLTFLVVGIFMTLAARDLWGILARNAGKVVGSGCLLVAWALLVSAYLRSVQTAVCVVVVGMWLVTILAMREDWRGGRLRLSSAYVLVFYLALPMAAIIALRMSPVGGQLVGFLLLVSCFTDTGGFYVGSAFGRRPLSPSLSPRKTVEGVIGGIVFAYLSVIVWGVLQNYWLSPGHLFWMRYEPAAWVEIFALTLAIAVLAQIGDLAESMLKRDAGVKDSGINTTGHGGFLDMLDSLLWTSPAMFVFALLTGLL